MAPFVVGADGSNLTRIAEPALEAWGGRLAWSPVGRRIAFLDHGVIMRSVAVDVLSVLDLGTGAIEALTRGFFGPFLWSPDGSEIFYDSHGSSDNAGNPFSEPGLFAVAVEGEDAIRRLAEAEWSTISGMAWSPDRTRLAVTTELDFYGYSREGREGTVVLYTIATDGSDQRALVRQDPDGQLVATGEAE